MMRDIVLRSWRDDIGNIYRMGRRGSHYFIELIVPAYERAAGTISRTYVSKARALEFDPAEWDDVDFLEYYRNY